LELTFTGKSGIPLRALGLYESPSPRVLPAAIPSARGAENHCGDFFNLTPWK
jgi:hypothetical protein